MKLEEIRIDTYSNSSPEVSMTLTHLPTGISVKGTGKGQIKLRQKLMQELEDLVTHPPQKA